jgi:hypothetical protein
VVLRLSVTHGECFFFIDIQRTHAKLLQAIGAELNRNRLINRTGQHEAEVVIGMFTNEIHAPWGGKQATLPAEALSESAVDFSCIDHFTTRLCRSPQAQRQWRRRLL